MSDNDHGSGVLGGLMAGAAITSLLLLPVAIMRRLGVPLTTVVSATVMAAFAIAHPAIAE